MRRGEDVGGVAGGFERGSDRARLRPRDPGHLDLADGVLYPMGGLTTLIERMAKDPARHAASDGPRLQGVISRIAELEAAWMAATADIEAAK